jgi:uncharacterized membrane protein
MNSSYINSLDGRCRKGDFNMPKRKWTKEEIKEYRKNHSDVFYYNKEDSNFLVPKAYGIGRTFNFANPISWFFIAVIIGLIVFRKFF